MWMFLWSFNFCNFIKMNMLTNHLVANISSCPQPNPVIWIYNTFNQCVYNFKSELGLCLGLVSICCWMSAGFPQVISNFRQKKVHEAWSIYSLLLWLCGDSCNLIGCILIKQFPVQLYTSCYYVTMDIIIISQFFYCLYLHRLQEQPGRDTFRGVANQPWSPRTHRRGTIILTCVFTALLSLPKLGFHDNDKTEVFKSRKLLEVEFTKWAPQLIVGYVIGCLSAILYLSSRIPQIVKNFQRKKTDGVCYSLFLLAALGNSLYGASVMTSSMALQSFNILFCRLFSKILQIRFPVENFWSGKLLGWLDL